MPATDPGTRIMGLLIQHRDVLKLMDLSAPGGTAAGEKVFNHYRRIMPVTEIERCERRFAAVALPI